MSENRSSRLALMALATALTLAGCGGQPTQPTVDTGPTTPPSIDPGPLGPDYVPGQFAPYLNEAETALAEEHWLAAIASLQKVPQNLPPGTDVTGHYPADREAELVALGYLAPKEQVEDADPDKPTVQQSPRQGGRARRRHQSGDKQRGD